MRQKLLVPGSLLAIAVVILGTATRQLRAKMAEERFAELYDAVGPGMSSRELESKYGFPKSRPADPIEMMAIHNALYVKWPDVPRDVGGARFDDRKQWLRFMQSGPVEWRVWEHPGDNRRWIAVAELEFGMGNRTIIYKLRCGF